ncbi:MAG: hypothetical protein SFV81_29795 [Pirellulaceae bacterium]|nr:hypothetical protein [Pirellulaceae bacterium]
MDWLPGDWDPRKPFTVAAVDSPGRGGRWLTRIRRPDVFVFPVQKVNATPTERGMNLCGFMFGVS